MPTTWILLTVSFRKLHWSKTCMTSLFYCHVVITLAKMYWAFHCTTHFVFIFSELCITWFSLTPFLTNPPKCSPLGRMVSLQCLTHAICCLWDLDTFLSLHPESLPSPLSVQALKVQFTFYLVSVVVPDRSCSTPSVCSELLLCYALYSLAFSAMPS